MVFSTSSIPKGEDKDVRLLNEAYDAIALYLMKSSPEYRRCGVNCVIGELQKFQDNEEQFMRELAGQRHGLDKTHKTRSNRGISYVGMQGTEVRVKSHRRSADKSVDGSHLACENNQSTGEDVSAVVEDQGMLDVTTQDDDGIKSNQSDTEFERDNGLPSPRVSPQRAEKRERDKLGKYIEDSPTKKVIVQSIYDADTNAEVPVAEKADVVGKLLDSIYAYEYNPDSCESVMEDELLTEGSKDNLDYIEDENLQKVLMLDKSVENFEKERRKLSRKTAFALMEIAEVSVEMEKVKKSLFKQMFSVYEKYAISKNYGDPNVCATAKVKSLREFTRRGRKVLRLAGIAGGRSSLDLYIPFEFNWSCYYRLKQEDVGRFCELFQTHVDMERESRLNSDTKDFEITAEKVYNNIGLDPKLLSGSPSKSVSTPDVFKFDPSEDSSCCESHAQDHIENYGITKASNLEAKYMKLLIFGKPFAISSESLSNLKKENGWLSDDIINSYLFHIVAQVIPDASDKVLMMQTFVSQKIERYKGGSAELELIKKYIENGAGKSEGSRSFYWAVGIFNVGKHWIAVVVDFINGMVYEMDSISQAKDGAGYGRELTRKFSDALQQIYGKKFITKVKNVHQQENGYDCGILALVNAESFMKIIADGKNFDQESIPADTTAACYREKMIECYDTQKEVQTECL